MGAVQPLIPARFRMDEKDAMVWASLLESASIIVAAVVGIFGINAWRREHVGKRRIELAEEVMALFYEARDAIADVRNPLSLQAEGESRPASGRETEGDKLARDRAYIPIKRLQERSQLFSRIFAVQYRFMAMFGQEAGQPFLDLDTVIREIRVASGCLGDYLAERAVAANREERQRLAEDIRRAEGVVSASFADGADEIAQRMSGIVNQVEGTCRPVIAEWTTGQFAKWWHGLGIWR